MSFSLFFSNPSIASSIEYVAEINGEKSILSDFNILNAAGNCPQREPKTVISSITIGARLNSFDAATVLFKTKTPRGFVKAKAVSNPEIEPVASTTTSLQYQVYFGVYQPKLHQSFEHLELML